MGAFVRFPSTIQTRRRQLMGDCDLSLLHKEKKRKKKNSRGRNPPMQLPAACNTE